MAKQTVVWTPSGKNKKTWRYEGQTSSFSVQGDIRKDVLIMRHWLCLWISFHGNHVQPHPDTHRGRPLHHSAMSLDKITSFSKPRTILYPAGSSRWTHKLFSGLKLSVQKWTYGKLKVIRIMGYSRIRPGWAQDTNLSGLRVVSWAFSRLFTVSMIFRFL